MFSIFKKKLLEQYAETTLYQIIEDFATENLSLLYDFFELAFGIFSSYIYEKILAQAYEEKINTLAETL